jgi:hypothetical protein
VRNPFDSSLFAFYELRMGRVPQLLFLYDLRCGLVAPVPQGGTGVPGKPVLGLLGCRPAVVGTPTSAHQSIPTPMP